VYKDTAGKYRFRLRADNNKIVAVGEAYEQYASCLNGIKSIQKNCKAQVEDTTVEGQRLPNPKFQVYKDTAGKFRFHLNARNGEIIAESEGYETKDACLNGIEAVGQSSDAEIEDLTESQAPAKQDFISTTEPIAAKAENTLPDSQKQDYISATSTSTAEIKTSQVVSTTKPEVIVLDREDEILAELKKISAALEKAPPPQAPKGLWNEFKDFLSKYKILGLAVAFILALYAGILIQALVKDFIIPLLGLVIPGMSDLATYSVGVLSQVFGIGDFLVALITFVIVAFIVFIIVKVAKKWHME
jgi:large conductance mechanosensitive channel protein